MRCPNGTRRNKTTMECESPKRKTEKRCPNGTRRNKEGVCTPPPLRKRILNTVTPDRVYRGKPLSRIQSEAFIQLCKKHILRPNLDSVQDTYWLLNGDSILFMIAERHNPYKKCDSILEMFKALLKENSSHPVDIDIMIEQLQGSIRYKMSKMLINNQISRIREFFNSCIVNKNCSARVHWTDPTYTEKGNPEWIQALGDEKYYSKFYTREWMKDPLIHAEIQSKEDIVKILTKNVYVVKEIERASKVYPQFTVDFAAKDFMSSMNHDLQHVGWEECVIFMSRLVMDYYTVARIIKSRMKNVIIYAGANHITRMIRILEKTGYSIQKHVKGKCVE